MFTITDSDGAPVLTTRELWHARFITDGSGLGYRIADEAGVVIYICTPESLDPEFDLFNDLPGDTP